MSLDTEEQGPWGVCRPVLRAALLSPRDVKGGGLRQEKGPRGTTNPAQTASKSHPTSGHKQPGLSVPPAPRPSHLGHAGSPHLPAHSSLHPRPLKVGHAQEQSKEGSKGRRGSPPPSSGWTVQSAGKRREKQLCHQPRGRCFGGKGGQRESILPGEKGPGSL